jgi:hypothetical protein
MQGQMFRSQFGVPRRPQARQAAQQGHHGQRGAAEEPRAPVHNVMVGLVQLLPVLLLLLLSLFSGKCLCPKTKTSNPYTQVLLPILVLLLMSLFAGGWQLGAALGRQSLGGGRTMACRLACRLREPIAVPTITPSTITSLIRHQRRPTDCNIDHSTPHPSSHAGSGSPSYQLSQDARYPARLRTQRLEVHYYVPSEYEFERSYPIRSSGRTKLERQVESDHYERVSQRCQSEQIARQRMRYSFRQRDSAKDMPMPNCEEVEAINRRLGRAY